MYRFLSPLPNFIDVPTYNFSPCSLFPHSRQCKLFKNRYIAPFIWTHGQLPTTLRIKAKLFHHHQGRLYYHWTPIPPNLSTTPTMCPQAPATSAWLQYLEHTRTDLALWSFVLLSVWNILPPYCFKPQFFHAIHLLGNSHMFRKPCLATLCHVVHFLLCIFHGPHHSPE